MGTALDALLRRSQTSTWLWEALKWHPTSLDSNLRGLPRLAPCHLSDLSHSTPASVGNLSLIPQAHQGGSTQLVLLFGTLLYWWSSSPLHLPQAFAPMPPPQSGFLWAPSWQPKSSPPSSLPSMYFWSPFSVLTLFCSAYCYLLDFLCIWLICLLNVSSWRLEVLVFVPEWFLVYGITAPGSFHLTSSNPNAEILRFAAKGGYTRKAAKWGDWKTNLWPASPKPRAGGCLGNKERKQPGSLRHGVQGESGERWLGQSAVIVIIVLFRCN